MKTLLLSAMLLGCLISANAQISEKQLQPFIKGMQIIDTSGPGLSAASGDILLELKDEENPDYETLLLLRNNNGKLTRITENANLLMGEGILGVSGGNYPGLSGNKISVDYTLGSSSAQSDVSITFEKNQDGKYYFTNYTKIARNYGVENLFAREEIRAVQTGKISFGEATEDLILKKADATNSGKDDGEVVYKASGQYAQYLPEGYQLAAYATGDLNADNYKKDLVLVLKGEQNCSIRLLLQQKDGSYQFTQHNDQLIAADNTYNANNLRVVIKNSYFTVEQRIAIKDEDFDHRYITFKYDALQKNWLLHRFDVEHYSGFNPKPYQNVTHLSTKDFGTIKFREMDHLPGVYRFGPELSEISGTIVLKAFPGNPASGTDKKVAVYILKPNYPVNVYGDYETQHEEMADRTVTDIQEIQLYSTDPKIDLKKYEGKAIKLQGLFQAAQTAHHYTQVIFEVKKVL